jgi:hypothetical protein
MRGAMDHGTAMSPLIPSCQQLESERAMERTAFCVFYFCAFLIRAFLNWYFYFKFGHF